MAISEADGHLTMMVAESTGLPELGYEQDVAEHIENEIIPGFWETPTGKFFKDNFTANSWPRVLAEYNRRFNAGSWPNLLLIHRLEQVVGDLVKLKDPALELIEDEEDDETESAAEQPRDSRGKFVSEILAEVEEDIASPLISTAEIKKKRSQSREYNLAFEKAHTPEVTRDETPDVDDDILAFADWFNNSPASQTTASAFRNGVIVANGNKFTRAQYDRLLAVVSHKGLIR